MIWELQIKDDYKGTSKNECFVHLSKFFQDQSEDPEVEHYLWGSRAKGWWWAEV